MTGPDCSSALRAYVKLFRATHAVRSRVERRAALAAGLTLTQIGVLDALLHKGPLAHRDLSRKLLTSAGNLSDVIDKLETRGLVLRVRDPLDRRLVRVGLTAAGRATITDLFPRHAAVIAAVMGGLPAEDLALLEQLLRRLGHHASGLEPVTESGPAVIRSPPRAGKA